MSDVKYEMIFGDESLFDGAPEDAAAVFKSSANDSRCVYYRLSNGHERYSSGEWVGVHSIDSQTFNAMRRIIPEPKRWTQADKDAGRSPVYGAILESNGGSRVKFLAENNRGLFHCQYDDGSICAYLPKFFKPIETPEEKAQRERDEWIDNACSFICFYDIGRVDAIKSLEITYDKLKSGELPMPGKE